MAVFLFWWCLSIAAIGQNNAAKQPGDASVFLEAVRLSYNGDHDAARVKFQEYHKNHPEDLLAPLRMFDDRFFDARSSKMDGDTYRQLLETLNGAIATFEKKGGRCTGTDFRGIAGDTIDCNYLGAALYGSRMALFLKYHWFLKSIAAYADNKKFSACINGSTSVQAKFLLGVREYEKSIFLGKSPDAAFEKIIDSLSDKSPFADDIWLFVLRTEDQKKPGAERFERQYPSADIRARLKEKYPGNPVVREGSDSFEKIH